MLGPSPSMTQWMLQLSPDLRPSKHAEMGIVMAVLVTAIHVLVAWA